MKGDVPVKKDNTREWIFEAGDKKHKISFTPKFWTGRHELWVDGARTPVEREPFRSLMGIDQSIDLGDRVCRLVWTGGQADLAVDGVFLDSGRPYRPMKLPRWSWPFIILCLLIPLVAMGGGIPIIIGLLGAYGCVRAAVGGNRTKKQRVLLSAGIVLLAWVVFGLMFFAVALLRI